MLREQLDRLWSYKTREGVMQFLFGWLKALRWQRLPEMKKLGDTLVKPLLTALPPTAITPCASAWSSR